MASLLYCDSLSKHFAGVRALKNVCFHAEAGTVHALVGENGAGKSTLIKIIAGVYQPDSGGMAFNGNSVRWTSPLEARQAGIAVVHQEADLFLDLSVCENVLFASSFPKNAFGLIDWKKAEQRFLHAAQQIGETIPPQLPARQLSSAGRQMTEIMAAVSQDARVIFMDEPTASLSQRECEILFQHIRQWKAQGRCVVYVSHRMEEIMMLADTVTVLRDGEHVLTKPAAALSREEIITAMVGRDAAYPAYLAPRTGETVFECIALADTHNRVKQVSLDVKAGEIVGLYGLVGAGRSEWAQMVYGLRQCSSGEMKIDGKTYQPKSPRDAIQQGIVYVPEDRLVDGLFLNQSVQSNLTVTVLHELLHYGCLSSSAETKIAHSIKDEFQIKTNSVQQPVSSLSGGNQQKAVLGRWLSRQPKLVILDEPTRGVDIGAKIEIHRLVRELTSQGMAVVIISSELPEIMAVCDRVSVMCEGNISGEFLRNGMNDEALLNAALPVAEPLKLDSYSQSEPPSFLNRMINVYLHQREAGVAFILAALWLILWIAAPSFRSIDAVASVLLDSAWIMIAAVGMTMVIAAGGIDISIGSLLALSAVCGGTLLDQGYPVPVAIGAALTCGAFGGFLNGCITYYGGIHSILTTLGTLNIFRALVIYFTGGKWISNLPDSYTWIGRESFCWISLPVWVAAVLVAIASIWLKNTVTGRSIFALGSNPKAALLMGLSQRRIRLLTFMFGGVFVAAAGILHTARHGQVQTNMGMGFELDVIAAAVLGGCSIMGGTGSAIGAALGALLLGTVRSALVALHVSTFYEQAATGVLILFAVTADHLLEKRKRAMR